MALLIPELGYLRQARPRPIRGLPLHLTATATVLPGASAGVNAPALKGPRQKPIVISAIKFQVQPAVVGSMLTDTETVPVFANGQPSHFALGAVVEAAFTVAKLIGDSNNETAITEGEGVTVGRTPIAALCDARNLTADALTGAYVQTGQTVPAPNKHPISEYRWDLDKPLYLPPDYILLPQLRHQGLYFAGSVGAAGAAPTTAVRQPIPSLSVRISYEGTVLNGPEDYHEDVIHIPYGAGYEANDVVGTSVGGGTGFSFSTYSDTSLETELANPFSERVTVTKFIGKLIEPGQIRELAVDIGPGLKLRMQKSNGDAIVRDLGEFRAIFDKQTRCWACRLPLDSGEYITVYLTAQDTVGVAAPGNVFNNVVMSPLVGMVGYRDIPRSRLEG